MTQLYLTCDLATLKTFIWFNLPNCSLEVATNRFWLEMLDLAVFVRSNSSRNHEIALWQDAVQNAEASYWLDLDAWASTCGKPTLIP
jgi:hypothetical protein